MNFLKHACSGPNIRQTRYF